MNSVTRRRPDAEQGGWIDGVSVHGWAGLDKSGIWKLIEWGEFMRALVADDAKVAESAHVDVASIANVKAGLDSSGLRKFIYLGDFMRVHRIKLRESDWIAWWRHSSILASGAGSYEAESIWVLLDGAGLRKVKRIELTHGSVEHKGPGLGRIHGLTEKTRVTRTQYSG